MYLYIYTYITGATACAMVWQIATAAFCNVLLSASGVVAASAADWSQRRNKPRSPLRTKGTCKGGHLHIGIKKVKGGVCNVSYLKT